MAALFYAVIILQAHLLVMNILQMDVHGNIVIANKMDAGNTIVMKVLAQILQ